MHEPRAIVTFSVMCPRDNEEAIRFADALFTWERYFQSGLAVSCPVGTWVRSLEHPGGSIPFFRSMIDFGFTKARPNDVVIYTNSDICLTLYGLERVMQTALDHGAATAPRANFDYESRKIYSTIPEAYDGGIDLIAVTRGWWLKNRRSLPDFVIGREGWDTVFAAVAKVTTGNQCEVYGATYHRLHKAFWIENKFTDPGQLYNRGLMFKFKELWDRVLSEMPFLIE